MEIKDSLGKYILKVDIKRNLVYETNIGYWKPEDMQRFENDYTTKIIPLLKDKKWAKCCELRQYKTSMITDEIEEHTKYCIQNGYVMAAVVLNDLDKYKSVIHLQMKIISDHTGLPFEKFTSIEEADKWLNEKGF